MNARVAGSLVAPRWLRDLGLTTWLLVGVGIGALGLILAALVTSAVTRISAELAQARQEEAAAGANPDAVADAVPP